jgi:hypothetical protein
MTRHGHVQERNGDVPLVLIDHEGFCREILGRSIVNHARQRTIVV